MDAGGYLDTFCSRPAFIFFAKNCTNVIGRCAESIFLHHNILYMPFQVTEFLRLRPLVSVDNSLAHSYTVLTKKASIAKPPKTHAMPAAALVLTFSYSSSVPLAVCNLIKVTLQLSPNMAALVNCRFIRENRRVG